MRVVDVFAIPCQQEKGESKSGDVVVASGVVIVMVKRGSSPAEFVRPESLDAKAR